MNPTKKITSLPVKRELEENDLILIVDKNDNDKTKTTSATSFIRMSDPSSEFSSRLSTYNWKPSNTSKLRKALADAETEQHATIIFVGDSITSAVPNGPRCTPLTCSPRPDGSPLSVHYS